jgi:hypothetical protein
MTDKHDKLVEMALKSGAVNHFVQGLPDRYAFSLGELAAFRDRIVASLCADVEQDGFRLVSVNAGFTELMEALDRADRKGYMPDAIYSAYEGFQYRDPASTVASLTAQRDAALARVAELEKDAARYRWLRSVPNAFKAQRIVNDTPHGMDATIDAAMNGGNQ